MIKEKTQANEGSQPVKVAFVTGGGRGIGEAVSRALAESRVAVAIAARTECEIQAVAESIRDQGGQAVAVRCDVTDPASIADAVAQVHQVLGPITILVNNAGAAGSDKLLGHDDALWQFLINMNLTSVYRVTKTVLPMMIKAKWGRIINIGSIASKIGSKYLTAYTASKHGVLGLTRTWATELEQYHITVNIVCPGYVDTPMTDASVASICERTGMSEPEARRALEEMNPQKRLIRPKEVAIVVRMLVEDDAQGITGQAINVDGGAALQFSE